MKAKIIFFGFAGGFVLLRCFLIDPTPSPANAPQELQAVQNPPGAVFSNPSDTCNDDEKVRCCFVGMPENLTPEMKIASTDEPGERMEIRGFIYKADGKTPYPNVLMYAYHTDEKGIYSKTGDETGIRRWHGRLHGWCRTDANGRYAILSIRPASYPNSRNPAHIHQVVWESASSEPYFINETVFSDDKFVDDRYRENEKRNGGSSGITKLVKNTQGVWEGKRIIVLK